MNNSITKYELNELAATGAELIKTNNYITVATVDENGEPWNSPLNTAFDEDLNFYWKSPNDCQHSFNIRNNGKVFFVLFDSHAEVGKGIGVYFKGHAMQLEEDEPEEIQKGNNLIAKRISTNASNFTEFIFDKPRRVYKAVPTEIWMNVIRKINGQNVDGKIELPIELIKELITSN